MKSNNLFKYIFVLVVIALVGGAVYILYQNNEQKKAELEEENSVQSNNISVSKELNIGITGFDTMNPLLTKNKEIININKLIFEPLVNVTSDYKVEYCLASECSKVSDTSYIIKLNTKAKWQDGNPIIAKDVKFTIDTLKSVDSIYSYNVSQVESLEIIDSETIRINLFQEVPFFEYQLVFPILSHNYYFNEDFMSTNKIPMGTGMYKIASVDEKNIMLTQNDKWIKYKENMPRVEKITIQKYESMGEIYNAFKMRSIDFVHTSILNYTDYVGTVGYNKKEYKGREYDFLALNCNDNILSDKAVRSAIDYAIDKQSIIATVFNNQYYTAKSPLDYGSYLYTNTDSSQGYSIDQAKRTLEESGWIYQKNRWEKKENNITRVLNLTLTVSQDDTNRVQVAELIKSQLEQVGINVTVSKVTSNAYSTQLNNRSYQMILTGIYSSISPDLTYFYDNGNLANYHNEEVKNLLNEVKDITDTNVLLEKYNQIEKVVKEDTPYISLYRNKNTLLLNANMSGEFTPNNHMLFYNFNKWYVQR